MHAIRIDRGKPLAAEPHLGHNRYHPDIAPVVEIGEGEEIALETRDALDGQIKPAMAAADLASIEAGAVHPLTGPVFVKGAEPGDILEIEFTESSRSRSRSARSCRGSAFCAMYSPSRSLCIGSSAMGGPPPSRSPGCAFRVRRSWACRRWRPR